MLAVQDEAEAENGVHRCIRVEDILYACAAQAFAREVLTQHGKTEHSARAVGICVRTARRLYRVQVRTLADLVPVLPPHFLRVNKGFVVNLHQAKSLVLREKRKGIGFAIENGRGEDVEWIPIGRRRLARVRRAFGVLSRRAPGK